jgi:nitrogen PTS system EIIA component
MPKLGELLSPDSIMFKAVGKDRREIMKSMANIASNAFGIDANIAFEATMTREALGGTGVGEGVAVPHARVKGIDKSYGVFALLAEPVDFESPDGKPADLIFMLLSPEESGANHLKALAKITRLLRQPAIRAELRAARSQSALHALLVEVEGAKVA